MAKKKEAVQISAREIRRKRRVRNQAIAYVVVALLLVSVGVGLFFGVRYVSGLIEEKQMEQALAEEMAALEEEQELAEQEEQEEKEPEEVIEEYTEEDLLDDMIDAGVAEMPLEDKVAGLFLTRPESLTGVGKVIQAGESTQEALAQYAVAGLVYEASNVQSKQQFAQMLTDTLPKSKYPLFFIMDGEHPLTEDLSEYGINMEFVGKDDEAETAVFQTATLPSLLGGAQEEGLATALVSGDGDSIGEACLGAWKNGADLLYVPENFEAAYEGMLEGIRSDESLEEMLEESLERIYRIKYRGRLSE